MNRAYRLHFCQQCVKKEFSKQKGIVCSLTQEHALFDQECTDYELDPSAAKYEARAIEAKQLREEEVGSSGFATQGLWGGIAAIVIAVVWFGIGIAAGRIFFYPFALVVLGIIGIINGVNQQAEKSRERKQPQDLIDNSKEEKDLLDF